MGCKLLEAAHYCNDTHGKSRKKENPAVVGKEPTMCVSASQTSMAASRIHAEGMCASDDCDRAHWGDVPVMQLKCGQISFFFVFFWRHSLDLGRRIKFQTG